MQYIVKISLIKELNRKEISIPGLPALSKSQSTILKIFATNLQCEEALTVGQIKEMAREKLGDLSSYTIDREVIYYGGEEKDDDNETLLETRAIKYSLITN
jgi:hypothetical protein